MRLLLPLLIAFSPMTMAAELILKGPVELLAVTPAQAIADNKVTLPAGEHQLLVRYQDVVVSRSNNDSDIDVRSEPQVLRLTVGADDKLVLSAPSLNGQKEMESFAKKPSFTLTGNSSQPVQDEVKLKGFLIGVDYDDVLANYNRGSGPAVLSANQATSTTAAVATTAVAATAVAAPATVTTQSKPAVMPATSHEQALKDLFLKSSPEERKRFMSWAVQQF